MPLKLTTRADGLELTFRDPLDRESAADPRNYLVRAWDLKRSANYGSKHLNERELKVLSATLRDDGRSVRLEVEGIGPTRGMEIRYAIQAADGTRLNSAIHNTIHKLPQR